MKNYAIIFPGQGAQKKGMLSAYAGHPTVATSVAEVSAAIDVDLAQLIENDEHQLSQTINTQPAMLAIGVGVYRALQDRLPSPLYFAGHSLGEYSALVCAGALSLTAAAQLVRRRAQLMQEAVTDGGMAAILGLPAVTVERICADLRQQGESVWPANYNTSQQIVIAGLQQSVEVAMTALTAAGAKRALWLSMSVPSHCPLLQAVATVYRQVLAAVDWQVPQIPIIHTATVDTATPDALAQTMSAQLVQPIRWPDMLQRLQQGGVEQIYESGPGNILTNLGKKSGIPHSAINDASALQAIVTAES